MRELWLGHEIKLASAYYRPTVADMREEYSKAINLLTINEEKQTKGEGQVHQLTKYY